MGYGCIRLVWRYSFGDVIRFHVDRKVVEDCESVIKNVKKTLFFLRYQKRECFVKDN